MLIIACNRENSCVVCGSKNICDCVLTVCMLGRRRSGDKGVNDENISVNHFAEN